MDAKPIARPIVDAKFFENRCFYMCPSCYGYELHEVYEDGWVKRLTCKVCRREVNIRKFGLCARCGSSVSFAITDIKESRRCIVSTNVDGNEEIFSAPLVVRISQPTLIHHTCGSTLKQS